jgi:tRNA modification GTPase
MSPTIFALASGAGRAAIAVLRISGPKASQVLRALIGPLPPPRHARLARFRDPETNETLDQGLALWFPGPQSYTGEDMAELHLHGGRAVVAGLISVLSRLPDLQPAEPGEFSRRAFLNAKLDLTEVEAIGDLVDAETEAQRRQALRQLDGEFGKRIEAWRHRLVRGLAHMEAAIDFAEDDPSVSADKLRADMEKLGREIGECLKDNRRGETLREGFSVAILGPPNAGKSSLLNRLAGREAAIVSERAGTTRDVIEVHLDLAGLPVILADTAGLRETSDEIESEGVRRALHRAESADLNLLVLEGSNVLAVDSISKQVVSESKRASAAPMIVIANKCDLVSDVNRTANNIRDLLNEKNLPVIAVSAKTGDGISDLLAALEQAASQNLTGGPAAVTRARHRAGLEECAGALARFAQAREPELAAEDLRLAARALGRITGRVDVEDLLDVIFRDFCIGK